MSQSVGVIVCAAIVSYSATLPTFTSPISEECLSLMVSYFDVILVSVPSLKFDCHVTPI